MVRSIRLHLLLLLLRLQWLLIFCCFVFSSASAKPAPYAMRINCGARHDVHTAPTNTLWYRDFGYTGGIPANASLPSYVSPHLDTLRYFPLSEGPENCYIINRVPKGHYSVRVFFGSVQLKSDDLEPLFDISVEGTLITSLKSGWSNVDDQVFAEAQVFLTDGSVSICFHSTGHGDPAILALEILQIDDKAYQFSQHSGQGIILRTVLRLSCGDGRPKFGADYGGDPWGGDRFWKPITTFGGGDKSISIEASIKQVSKPPNFYPAGLYERAIVSSDSKPDIEYTMDVDPNRNYSIWLHFAEIDESINGVGQRVFDIIINGDIAFEEVDIVKFSGDRNSALVLNTTVPVNGRSLTITLKPKNRDHAIICAIEIFEIIVAESKTLPDEVKALQTLKTTLGLPVRLGWNGDPCVPQQHPWSGADCQFDKSTSKWVIDGLYVHDLVSHASVSILFDLSSDSIFLKLLVASISIAYVLQLLLSLFFLIRETTLSNPFSLSIYNIFGFSATLAPIWLVSRNKQRHSLESYVHISHYLPTCHLFAFLLKGFTATSKNFYHPASESELFCCVLASSDLFTVMFDPHLKSCSSPRPLKSNLSCRILVY